MSQDGQNSIRHTFHIISIICCIIAIFICLAEIVPAVLSCAWSAEIRKRHEDDEKGLLVTDFYVTLIVAIIYLICIIIFTIITFGLGIFTILFLIPFAFVYFALKEAMMLSA